METKGHGPRWVDARFIRDRLSIGKTASYEVIEHIRRTSEEPDAVLRIVNRLRVREDVLDGWIRNRGIAEGAERPPADGRDGDEDAA